MYVDEEMKVLKMHWRQSEGVFRCYVGRHLDPRLKTTTDLTEGETRHLQMGSCPVQQIVSSGDSFSP